MSRSITCPDCNGAGEREGIAHPGARFIRIECSFCEASGYITAERARWREVGQTHRRARMERLESLRECAKRLGVFASEISRFERGMIDPAQWHPYSPNEEVAQSHIGLEHELDAAKRALSPSSKDETK